jgi:hypothetical protein
MKFLPPTVSEREIAAPREAKPSSLLKNRALQKDQPGLIFSLTNCHNFTDVSHAFQAPVLNKPMIARSIIISLYSHPFPTWCP